MVACFSHIVCPQQASDNMVLLREHNLKETFKKNLRPTCSQRIRFAQTVHHTTSDFLCFFLAGEGGGSAMSMLLQHRHFHALQVFIIIIINQGFSCNGALLVSVMWAIRIRLLTLRSLTRDSAVGNVLLVSAMWGIHDRLLTLRNTLHDTLTKAAYKDNLYRRWRWQQTLVNQQVLAATCSFVRWQCFKKIFLL